MTTAPASDSIEPTDYDDTDAGFHEHGAACARRMAANYHSYLDWSNDPDRREWAERMAAASAAQAEAQATYAAVLRQRQTTTVLSPLLRQQLVEACQRLASRTDLPSEADVLDEMAHDLHLGVALYRAFLTAAGDDFGLIVCEVGDRAHDVERGLRVDHDGPCCAPLLGAGECDRCLDVHRALLDDALDRLVGLIGDSTVDRMRRAVAA